MGYHISNENEKINENMDTFYKQNVDQKKPDTKAYIRTIWFHL